MQTSRAERWPPETDSPGCSPRMRSRAVALLFLISIALPVVWGISARSARAEEAEFPASRPAAPETTEQLLALAALPTRGVMRPRPMLRPRLSRTTPKRTTKTESPILPPGFMRPTTSAAEHYARTPNAIRRLAGDPPATKVDVRVAEPVLLAQAGSSPVRIPTAGLFNRSASAPQLSAVGAAQSRTARQAATSASTQTGQRREPQRGEVAERRTARGPVPATRAEIEAARKARAATMAAGGTLPAPPRRRVAMHRMAAAAASSLNEATPFRTGGAGSARFSGSQAGASLGSGLDQAAEAISVVPGLRLEDVTLTAGYSSNGLPGARSLYQSTSSLGSDNDFRGSATLAFRKRFRTSSVGLTYTPSRTQRANFRQWNTTDHVLGLQMDKQVSRRWGLGLSASAADTGFEQFWFRRATLRRVENPPTSFDDLLQRVDSGEFTDEEFASILTGAPIVDDPGGRELDLSRVRSLNSTLTASYAKSARTTITMGGGLSRFQSNFLTGSDDRSDRVQVNNLGRQHAFVDASYRASAGLTWGTRYTGALSSSNFGDAQSHSGVGYLNKRISRYWDLGLEGGAGVVDVDQESALFRRFGNGSPSPLTWVAGGSLNYRYGGHRFGGRLRRQVGDPMGLAARSTIVAGFDWEYTNPRMPWIFTGGASYSSSDFGFAVFDDSTTALETSLYQGALTRRLSSNTALTTGYYFGRYESPLRGLLTGVSVHRVQASFLWRPVEAR